MTLDSHAVVRLTVHPAEQQQLIKRIKAHIAAGDKARDKADQHYIAAGQHLKTLKEHHSGSWAEWEALLKEQIGIGKSRASELMQIADGRKTVEEVRAAGAERKADHDGRKRVAPLRNGEDAEHRQPPAPAEAMKAKHAALDNEQAVPADHHITPVATGPSYGVEAITWDGTVFRNGVRLATREEASFYLTFAVDDRSLGYEVAVMLREIRVYESSLPPTTQDHNIDRRRDGRFSRAITFKDGTCGALAWHSVAP